LHARQSGTFIEGDRYIRVEAETRLKLKDLGG
jgi:hypothetical protein